MFNYFFSTIAFLFLLFIPLDVVADLCGKDDAREGIDSESMEASEDFSEFMESFWLNSMFRQKHTEYKVAVLKVNNSTGVLEENMLPGSRVPLLPDKKLLEDGSYQMNVDRRSLDALEVSVREAHSPYRSRTYFFRKKCQWSLFRVEERHYPEKIPSAWLLNIFPRINGCTPINLYFDVDLNRSFESRLESRGYAPEKLNGSGFVSYKIRENYFGASAVELLIPSEFDSTTSIRFLDAPSALAAMIKKGTGQDVAVLKEDAEALSGVAYILPEGHGSKLICKTFF